MSASNGRQNAPHASRGKEVRPLSRRRFLGQSIVAASAATGLACATSTPREAATDQTRPNILFAIADDWSWPHAGAYGARGVSTPAFDRVAKEGCLFSNVFTAAPQCSPNRAATLTGRNIWQIAEAGTHGSIFPTTYPVFPDLLEQSGYHVGYTRKGWAPGDWKRGGWTRNPAGPAYGKRKLKEVPAKGIAKDDYVGNFEAFLEARPKGAPFSFWYGASEPHRVYEQGSGVEAGKSPNDVTVPGFLPDVPEIRSDILDYFIEIEWFDTQLAKMLTLLEANGELDNTIVVVTGDNGMPFPRAKANLYEYGTHVPFAVRWPTGAKGGRVVEDLVSFIDLGPTFLEAAGVTPPDTMTGRSFLGALTGANQGKPARDFALTGRERHTHARFDNLGYPARAIRTSDYLYIRNMKPERWPAGDPDQYHDIDGSPSKSYILDHKEDQARFFEMAVGKRPAEELFHIKTDPECLNNLAQDPGNADVRKDLSDRLDALLTEQGDPRALGTGDIFESYPRVSHMRPELGGFAERGQYNPKYQPEK
ncbi:MAG: sulfatase [bacterium]|nr:sulfatase [bacterium]